jgi:TspO/MBR family
LLTAVACGRRYNRLNKWTPPKWLFGPAWGVMYAAQSYSGWRVLHQVLLLGRPLLLTRNHSPRLTKGMPGTHVPCRRTAVYR